MACVFLKPKIIGVYLIQFYKCKESKEDINNLQKAQFMLQEERAFYAGLRNAGEVEGNEGTPFLSQEVQTFLFEIFCFQMGDVQAPIIH